MWRWFDRFWWYVEFVMIVVLGLLLCFLPVIVANRDAIRSWLGL